MPESTTTSATTAAVYTDSSRYWKLCTAVLGLGFVIAVASHAGPATASAKGSTNLLAFHQSQAQAIKDAEAHQTLSIGGFDTIAGQPAFIILNEQGQRVGTLPMAASSNSGELHD